MLRHVSGWLSKQDSGRAPMQRKQTSLNLYLYFFAAVIIAHLENAPQATVDLLAIGFVIARIAHLVCYVANWPTTRSFIWVAGLGCVVAIFFQI